MTISTLNFGVNLDKLPYEEQIWAHNFVYKEVSKAAEEFMAVVFWAALNHQSHEQSLLDGQDTVIQKLKHSAELAGSKLVGHHPKAAPMVIKLLGKVVTTASGYAPNTPTTNLDMLFNDLEELSGNHLWVVEEMELLYQDELEKIAESASKFVKYHGLKGVGEMSQLSGRSRSTLVDWWNKDRELFEVVMLGCIQKKLINASKALDEKN